MDDRECHLLLFESILHNNVSLLRELLEGQQAKALVNQPGNDELRGSTPDGLTLLHYAVIKNNIDCVKCLLESGADPNIFDSVQSKTAMHLAVELNNHKIVELLISVPYVNLLLRDDRNLTCLEISQLNNNLPLYDTIKRKLDEQSKIKSGYHSLLSQACNNNDSKLLLQLLEKYKDHVRAKLPDSWSSRRESIVLQSVKELINWTNERSEVTILFKSASQGFTEICRILIQYGATEKRVPNTNYSPLYVAAYAGHCDTISLLLDNFPQSVQEFTIEGWSVLHACCLKNHHDAAKLILNREYPQELKKKFISQTGRYEYCFAFDVNAQDAAGQTALYLAAEFENEKMLDTLLTFKLEATLIDTTKQVVANDKDKSSSIPSKSTVPLYKHVRMVPDQHNQAPKEQKFSSGTQIDKIMRQLHKLDLKENNIDCSKSKSKQEEFQSEAIVNKQNFFICPFEVDTYCDYNSKTALHLAVLANNESLATTLLVHGANPNLPLLSKNPMMQSEDLKLSGDTNLSWFRATESTCLKEACKSNNEKLVDCLIRYGATDDDNIALQVAVDCENQRILSKLLSLKCIIDPDSKINKTCNVEFASKYKLDSKSSYQTISSTTFSSLFPSQAVSLNWKKLGCIQDIDPKWLIEASLVHNKKLKNLTNSLLAITKLDLSSNNFKFIHQLIFRLPSLRELNLSGNRLEALPDQDNKASYKDNKKHSQDQTTPTSKLIKSQRTALKRSKSSSISIELEKSNTIDINEILDWDLPCLESINLKDNRLIEIPDCLFGLPRLREIDISNNQIRNLPRSMWFAPALRELIASGNLLDDLPRMQSHIHSTMVGEDSDSNSNIDELDSLGSIGSGIDGKMNKPGIGEISSPIPNDKQVDAKKNTKKTKNLLKVTDLPLNHINCWKNKIDVLNLMLPEDTNATNLDSKQLTSRITHLNLSYNAFKTIPEVLSCIATELVSLNLSHNRLISLGCVKLYPSKLKSLDLSYNRLRNWFECPNDGEFKVCSLNQKQQKVSKQKSTSKQQASYCLHKLHNRLDSLKSLNLQGNQFNDIVLTSVLDQVFAKEKRTKAMKLESSSVPNSNSINICFPNITTLDLSNNFLASVTKQIVLLKDLSVLNISRNKYLHSLPSELGLLTKLWNLNVLGCSLNEPLKSIVESKNYKMIDLIGYLKSILEESKPYARMKLMLVGPQGIGKTSLLECMRQEGSSGFKRRSNPEHWTKRMGYSSKSNLKNQRGVTLSTVGIDIHDWVYEKKLQSNKHQRNQQTLGPVSFLTWDFGGQDEFYATHRYFLSKRSIYLVVWRLTDGIAGISNIQQWLVNIQSRAPCSPVIIVGTHEDMVSGGELSAQAKSCQESIRRQFIDVIDPDKCGFPRVCDSIIVSVKTKLNITLLCNRVYDVAFSLTAPGSTERLLEQKIPASYLYLEEIVGYIVADLQHKRKDPVLTYAEYKRMTSELFKAKFNRVFRDLEPPNSKEINYNSELQQATRFLHDNGVLLHYDDANLRDLYFLDAQWLSDVLAAVVSIKEINPYVKNGLMKIDDLPLLYKYVNINMTGGVQNYILNLLNKFEVALTWNTQYLLIPSLLPPEPEALNSQTSQTQVRMKFKPRGRSAVRRWDQKKRMPSSSRASSVETRNNDNNKTGIKLDIIEQKETSIARVILLQYLPAGFFARLQSTILSDPVFDDICLDIYSHLNTCLNNDSKLHDCLGETPGWICWKSGIRLLMQHESTINCQNDQSPAAIDLYANDLISSKRPNNSPQPPALFEIVESQVCKSSDFLFSKRDLCLFNGGYEDGRPRIEKEEVQSSSENRKDEQSKMKPNSTTTTLSSASCWETVNIWHYSHCLMIKVNNWSIKVTNSDKSIQVYDLEKVQLAKILAVLVEHIDNLLEDWYPALGTRFMHTFGGRYLVIRVALCPRCLYSTNLNAAAQAYNAGVRQSRQQQMTTRHSRYQDSALSGNNTTHTRNMEYESNQPITCFFVEHLILSAYDLLPEYQGDESNDRKSEKSKNQSFTSSIVSALIGNKSSESKQRVSRRSSDSGHNLRRFECNYHGLVDLESIGPDIVFADISEQYKISSDVIERCQPIGRGAYGFVFRGHLKNVSTLPHIQSMGSQQYHFANKADESSSLHRSGINMDVALKLLQPVNPGPNSDSNDQAVYKSARLNWNREPFQCACRSYCTARHELNILSCLSHQNIVLFVGMTLKPLAIVLEYAPLGSMDTIIKNYKSANMQIDEYCIQKTILQVAKALEYLHQQRIIYRDLKSENVLVWSFPQPRLESKSRIDESVYLKLADYGISRQAMPTGIKGFGGTIGFLAPEILRHNGDEEYTEKVDCFSFGVFLYELLTLHPPFEPSEGIRRHLSEGGRPMLLTRDVNNYPDYIIDLMTVCCEQEPHHRPTASQIVSIASSPEFMQLRDVVSIDDIGRVDSSYKCIPLLVQKSNDQLELWFGDKNALVGNVLLAENNHWIARKRIQFVERDTSLQTRHMTSVCQVKDKLWICDSQMSVHVLASNISKALSKHNNSITGLNDTEKNIHTNTNLEGYEEDKLNCDELADTWGNFVKVGQFPLDLATAFSSDSPLWYIKQMMYVETANCVLMLSNFGTIWMASMDDEEKLINSKRLDDGSLTFVCMAVSETATYCSMNTKLSQYTANDNSSDRANDIEPNIQQQTNNSFTIWCGQTNGVSCLEIVDGSVRRQSILPLTEPIVERSSLTFESSTSLTSLSSSELVIATSNNSSNTNTQLQTSTKTNTNSTTSSPSMVSALSNISSTTKEVSCIVVRNNCLWTSFACIIYLWDIEERCTIRKLDCWKLVPCSESLASISIENYYEESRTSHVTSFEYLNELLFVGTSHGCFMVIEAMTLNPITVFKPYQSNVTILVPRKLAHTQSQQANKIDDDNQEENSENQKTCELSSCILTTGTDYRNLMSRYVNVADSSSLSQDWKTSDAAILWSATNWDVQAQ